MERKIENKQRGTIPHNGQMGPGRVKQAREQLKFGTTEIKGFVYQQANDS